MSWYCVDRRIQVKSWANLEFWSNRRKVWTIYPGVETGGEGLAREVTPSRQPPGGCRVSYGISSSWAWQAATGVLPGRRYAELQTRWEAFLLLLPGAVVAGHGKASWGELLIYRRWPCPRQLPPSWRLPPTLFLSGGAGSRSLHTGSNRYPFDRKSLLCWFASALTLMAQQFAWMSPCEPPRPTEPRFGRYISQSQTYFTSVPLYSDFFSFFLTQRRKKNVFPCVTYVFLNLLF